MKKRKIIYIYTREYYGYFPPDESDFYYLAGHTGLIARYFLKYTKRYYVENWRADKYVKKPVKQVRRGIVCRIFPSINLPFCGEWSFSMFKSLQNEIKSNKVIIHHSGVHKLHLYFLRLFFKNIPIVATQFGDISPFIISKNMKNLKKLKHQIANYLDKNILKDIDHFFVASKKEIDILTNFNSISRDRISFPEIGTDFKKFRPIDKKRVRKKLGLPIENKILLYIGKFDENKGLDVILKILPKLNAKYNLNLVLIGGSNRDRFYNKVKVPGIYYFGYLPYDLLPLYHNAADLFLRPAFSVNRVISVGADIIESLACNTPVVSTSLNDFPTHERIKLGELPKNEMDLVRCICQVLDNPTQYKHCRDIAKKYYDWENVVKRSIEVYDELFNKYYS